MYIWQIIKEANQRRILQAGRTTAVHLRALTLWEAVLRIIICLPTRRFMLGAEPPDVLMQQNYQRDAEP